MRSFPIAVLLFTLFVLVQFSSKVVSHPIYENFVPSTYYAHTNYNNYDHNSENKNTEYLNKNEHNYHNKEPESNHHFYYSEKLEDKDSDQHEYQDNEHSTGYNSSPDYNKELENNYDAAKFRKKEDTITEYSSTSDVHVPPFSITEKGSIPANPDTSAKFGFFKVFGGSTYKQPAVNTKSYTDKTPKTAPYHSNYNYYLTPTNQYHNSGEYNAANNNQGINYLQQSHLSQDNYYAPNQLNNMYDAYYNRFLPKNFLQDEENKRILHEMNYVPESVSYFYGNRLLDKDWESIPF